jgi:hypothetical protein
MGFVAPPIPLRSGGETPKNVVTGVPDGFYDIDKM